MHFTFFFISKSYRHNAYTLFHHKPLCQNLFVHACTSHAGQTANSASWEAKTPLGCTVLSGKAFSGRHPCVSLNAFHSCLRLVFFPSASILSCACLFVFVGFHSHSSKYDLRNFVTCVVAKCSFASVFYSASSSVHMILFHKFELPGYLTCRCNEHIDRLHVSLHTTLQLE